MTIKWIIALSSFVILSACANFAPGPGPDQVKLYDAVVFDITHANVLTPPGMQDAREFSKNIAERLLSSAVAKMASRKDHDLTIAATCGPRTLKVIGDISTITFRQKGKVNIWNPFTASTYQSQKVKVSIEGRAIDCMSGKTLSSSSDWTDDEDYNNIINNLAKDMTNLAIKAQWSR